MNIRSLFNKKLIYFLVGLVIIILSLITIIVIDKTESNKLSIENKDIRIVSLLPASTQSIYYLGAEDMLVGCTNYCKAAQNDNKEIVASVIKPNIEKIISLKPTIVLASDFLSSKDIETFQRFGIQVEIFPMPSSFNQICDQFIRLGRLVKQENKAVSIIKEAKDKMLKIEQAPILNDSKPRIFMQIGADPIYTVTSDNFMNDYIIYNGGVNIGESLTSGAIGREFVLSANPDFIFIVTMGIVADKEIEEWKKFANIKAVTNNRIFTLDSDIACQPTPITFVETLETMSKMINQ